MNTRRRAVAGSGIVIAIALGMDAIGYPGWLWFPLFVAFWLAALTIVISAVLEIRAHILHA